MSIIMRIHLLLMIVCVIWPADVLYARILVEDDIGNTIQLNGPATRIVSLSPHITELLFEAGAAQQVVGTVDYSDYPSAAKDIPRIGSFSKFDFEVIAALKPDLIIAWYSGNPAEQLEALKVLGVPVFYSEPEKLEHVASSIKRFGKLLGRETQAAAQAKKFLDRLAGLRKAYSGRSKIPVFYQVWNRPLMTVNGRHIINDVIELCGGVNVFAGLSSIAPSVDIESVLEKNPQVIIAGINSQRRDWLQGWQKWPSLTAVEHGHVYGVDPDLITRHTSRLLQGTQQVCDFIDKARE